MASDEAVADVRRKIGDTTEPYAYDAQLLSDLIDAANGDTDQVAADIWDEKAVQYSTMVDISEAGSSRKNSDLFKNAQSMSSMYRARAASDDSSEGVTFTTTRKIVRP